MRDVRHVPQKHRIMASMCMCVLDAYILLGHEVMTRRRIHGRRNQGPCMHLDSQSKQPVDSEVKTTLALGCIVGTLCMYCAAKCCTLRMYMPAYVQQRDIHEEYVLENTKVMNAEKN